MERKPPGLLQDSTEVSDGPPPDTDRSPTDP
jgi:hypothetical protein